MPIGVAPSCVIKVATMKNTDVTCALVMKYPLTVVKASQNQFYTLTIDFRRKFMLTANLVPFIFAIFSFMH